jgi:hypothetical protein
VTTSLVRAKVLIVGKASQEEWGQGAREQQANGAQRGAQKCKAAQHRTGLGADQQLWEKVGCADLVVITVSNKLHGIAGNRPDWVASGSSAPARTFGVVLC